MGDFKKVDAGEVVTPIMDGYLMKCCDCGLVHSFSFRAIRVTQRMPDGTFGYEHLDSDQYRVELVGERITGARKLRECSPGCIREQGHKGPCCSED